MNMAFLIGFTFGLLRYGLALIPPVALRVDSKKIAAAVSLAVACFYLLLSGSNVATERAFIMVSVMLVAVLLDRKALTLRSVAIAGTILLLWQPEALLSPGFQMSFAATVALIVGFRQVNDRMPPGRYPRWVMPVLAVLLSCLIGGMATAPLCCGAFQRFCGLRVAGQSADRAGDGAGGDARRGSGGALRAPWAGGAADVGDGTGVSLDPLRGLPHRRDGGRP